MNRMARVYGRSNIPLYLQIASTLRRRIETGQWQLGDQISTIPDLEREFGVARVTIRQAIDILDKEGLISRQQGRGTFVTKTIEVNHWLTLEVSLSSLVEMIDENVPIFLDVHTVPPLRLGASDGEPADEYVFLKSIQSRDGEPYGLVQAHVAKSIFDRAPDAFRQRTALPVLAKMPGIRIGRAHQTLVIRAAETDIADYLEIAVNAPTAEAHCVVTDDQNVAIYVAEIVYRGDRIKFDIELMQNLTGSNGK